MEVATKLEPVLSADYVCDVDVSRLAKKLENDDLFGLYDFRKNNYAHKGMTDIWLRYNRPSLVDSPEFNNEHSSVWYPQIRELPEALAICLLLMAEVGGERLGGVLVTKLPPGGRIEPHVDKGWHAEYYDKYYVPIKNGKGARFCWEDVVIEPKPGEVYQFDNSVPHWVENDSDEDRIAMIVCIKSVYGAFDE